MRSITPYLMFRHEAEDAVKHYVSIFDDSKILRIERYTEGEMKILQKVDASERPGPAGAVKTVRFLLKGEELEACNGGDFFHFSHGISLYVKCDTQHELDRAWAGLANGGTIEECGWISDRFGVSWQIVPETLERYLNDPDPETRDRVSQSVLKSKKLDFEILRQAYEGADYKSGKHAPMH